MQFFPLFPFGCQFSHFWHWAKWCFVTLKRVFYTYTCAVLWLDSSFFIPLDSRKICSDQEYIYFLGIFLHPFISSSDSVPMPMLWIMTHGWQMLEWKPDFIPLRICNPIFSALFRILKTRIGYEVWTQIRFTFLRSENEMAC